MLAVYIHTYVPVLNVVFSSIILCYEYMCALNVLIIIICMHTYVCIYMYIHACTSNIISSCANNTRD